MFKGNRKKVIAAFAAMMLVVASLAGCSASDAGFASLYMEVSGLKSIALSGDMEMEINPDAMYYYMHDEDSTVKMKLSFSGDIIVENPSDMYLDLEIKYGINSKDTPNKASLRVYNNVLYMPVSDYIDAHLESQKLSGVSDKMITKFKTAITEATGEYDYVILGDMSDMYQMSSFSGVSMTELMEDQEALRSIIVSSLKDMFSGLETGMTSVVPGGYSLEVTPEKAVGFVDKFVNYVSDNRDAIYKGYVKLARELQKYDEFAFIEDIDEATDREAFDEAIDDMTYYYAQSDWDKEYAKLLFKGSYLNTSVTKHGKEYAEDIDMNLRYRGDQMLKMKGNFTATVKDDIKHEAVSTENPVLMDDLDEQIGMIERAINYVKSAELKWWNRSYGYSDTSPIRSLYAELTLVEGSDWDYADCIDDYGTIYLPMRQVCEWFDEEVGWDNETKTAYVVRGGEKIDMTGRLEYKTMFVKVRDFEKLGYKIDYVHDTSDFYEHKVTIVRP